MISKTLVFIVALLILIAACAIFYIGPRNVVDNRSNDATKFPMKR